MPKIVDREEMQERIIAATMSAFVKYGHAATKMTDIATEAGLAKGTLYLYFQNKEELTLALVRACFALWEEQVKRAEPPETLEDFIVIVRGAITPGQTDRQATRMFFEIMGAGTNTPGLMEEVAAFYKMLGRFYAQNLRALKNNGVLSPRLNARAHGRAIASIADGLVIHRAMFELDDALYDEMVAAVLAQVRAGLTVGGVEHG
ncbi:hypothetical protein ACMU_10095 [Actibacterium mucosum KCTC 23349]|uniref:HTH tetR-type domain-containing protein n=1 Tax=Actibacterium mucosum KCTC 23349 TaxID=1454373 RepID=A0A037ZKD2_9RHOB|nr:TetR/AcrR family transcriptional regulator [Actibacterium mucosum]KAJ56099.1 hypothetical protein ACMU_10095 [Actibacterium mucosum KCTC 23349]